MDLEKAVQEYKQCGLVSHDLVRGLVEHFEATRGFSIMWSHDPSLSWAHNPRISFESSVAVECWFGGRVVKAYVSAYEFPLNTKRQEDLEQHLKLRCLQEWSKVLPEERLKLSVTYREPRD